MTTAWGVGQGSYSSSGLVIAGDDYLLLLHCQGDALERRILVLKDAGVEAILWSRAELALVIAQAWSHMGCSAYIILHDTRHGISIGWLSVTSSRSIPAAIGHDRYGEAGLGPPRRMRAVCVCVVLTNKVQDDGVQLSFRRRGGSAKHDAEMYCTVEMFPWALNLEP